MIEFMAMAYYIIRDSGSAPTEEGHNELKCTTGCAGNEYVHIAQVTHCKSIMSKEQMPVW